MTSRSRRRAAAPAFPSLHIGVQNGLTRLISDNSKTVADMLDCEDESTELLAEKCARVMKQQQLSAAQFLARFFEAEPLIEHAKSALSKSDKGTSVQLAERIAKEWAKNTALIPPTKANEVGKRKRTLDRNSEQPEESPVDEKGAKKKGKKSKQTTTEEKKL